LTGGNFSAIWRLVTEVAATDGKVRLRRPARSPYGDLAQVGTASAASLSGYDGGALQPRARLTLNR